MNAGLALALRSEPKVLVHMKGRWDRLSWFCEINNKLVEWVVSAQGKNEFNFLRSGKVRLSKPTFRNVLLI